MTNTLFLLFHFAVRCLVGIPKDIVSFCRKESSKINTRHDIMVDILINNILSQRGLIDHEQKWEDRKMVKTARDEITIGTEH